ncbi:MAG: hypothetical protein WA269_02760, partial [Candidatus Udaeobacter sp.]
RPRSHEIVQIRLNARSVRKPSLTSVLSLYEKERWTGSPRSDGFPAVICRRLPKPSFLGFYLSPFWGEDEGEGTSFSLSQIEVRQVI